MRHTIPSASDVRAKLQRLTLSDLNKLAAVSGVSVHTIYKIQRGETPNPGIETVAKFWPHLKTFREAA